MFHLTRLFLPLLDAGSTAQRPAAVVNVGSIAGLRPQSFPTFAYDASKAAVHHLTVKLAGSLADRRANGGHSITVNAIAPGYVPSRMSASLDTYTNGDDSVVKSIPLGRLGNAADMAGVLLWIASEAGSWVTGAVVPVDGGSLLVVPSGGAPQSKL